MSYVITPVGLPDYFYVSPYIGFTTVSGGALRYVSEEVARIAAKMVQKKLRKDFPLSRDLEVRECPTL